MSGKTRVSKISAMGQWFSEMSPATSSLYSFTHLCSKEILALKLKLQNDVNLLILATDKMFTCMFTFINNTLISSYNFSNITLPWNKTTIVAMLLTAERINTVTAPSDTAKTNFPLKITTNLQLKHTIEKDQGHSIKIKIVKNIETTKANIMRQKEGNSLTTKDNILNTNTKNTKRKRSTNKNLSRQTTTEIISTIRTLILDLRIVHQPNYCPMKETSPNFVEATICKICVMIKIIVANSMGFCSRIINVW